MSRKWWLIIGIAAATGIVAIIFGFTLLEQDSFLKNLLAEVVGLVFALALAIWIIEGPILTREERLRKVINIVVCSVMQLNEEIAITLSREIGEYLASRLDSNIDLYGEERGDWVAFKVLLRSIFRDARQVPLSGLPRSGPISESDYSGWVESARSFVARIHSKIGSDREVQANLYELLGHWNKLDAQIIKANYPYILRDEKERYAILGEMGDILIDLVEACPKIKD